MYGRFLGPTHSTAPCAECNVLCGMGGAVYGKFRDPETLYGDVCGAVCAAVHGGLIGVAAFDWRVDRGRGVRLAGSLGS